MALFLAVIFFLILFFYGWQAVKFFVGEKNIEALIPLSVVTGIGSYLFLLDLSSYLIPIQINFYIILVFLLSAGLLLYFINRRQGLDIGWGLNKKEIVYIFCTVLIIMVLNGLFLFRSLENDELAGYHLPSAALMSGGNFPVRQTNLPTEIVAYHYGSDLFLASVFKITGLPLWYAHDLVGFIAFGTFFLILFLIANLIIKNNFRAYLVAVLAFFGGGINFIYGFGGAVTLFKKFVLGQNIAHPFKFVSLMWEGGLNLSGPIVKYLQYLWGPMGWILWIAAIYLVLKILLSLDQPQRVKKIAVIAVILLSTFALNIEIVFAVLCLTLLFYPLVLFLVNRDLKQLKSSLAIFLPILFFTGLFSLIQGGTIPAILNNLLIGKLSHGQPLVYSFFKYPFSFIYDENQKIILPFYSWPFITNFGLLYFLIIPAAFFVCRRYLKVGLFLVFTSFISFVIPFVISFNQIWQDTMTRFFFPIACLWSLVVGIFLFWILSRVSKNKFFYSLVIICLVLIPLDGLFFQFSRLLYPLKSVGTDLHSFSGRLSPPTDIERSAYDWVKRNSTIKDYFLSFEKPANLGASNVQGYRFILYTQRFSPIYSETNNFVYPFFTNPNNNLTTFYKRLIVTCDSNLLHYLRYKYLFVDDSWPLGLEEKCLANNQLELKFNMQQGSEFIRIYEVK